MIPLESFGIPGRFRDYKMWVYGSSLEEDGMDL